MPLPLFTALEHVKRRQTCFLLGSVLWCWNLQFDSRQPIIESTRLSCCFSPRPSFIKEDAFLLGAVAASTPGFSGSHVPMVHGTALTTYYSYNHLVYII